MFTLYNGLTVALSVAVAAASLGLLLLRLAPGARRLRPLSAWAARWAPRRAGPWWDWKPIAAFVAVAYGLVVAFDVLTGQYACGVAGSTSDPIALLHSGQAFWAGQNPFLVHDCGVSTQIPYGFAAVLVDALGSLGGLAGIGAAWGCFAVAVVPLAWFAAPPKDRLYVTAFVALLPIYFPLVASQIDGASNAIVPVAVLGTIVLARRYGRWAELLGGFLATARFPSLFPVVASRGQQRHWFAGGFAVLASFGLVTALTYLRWGSSFYQIVYEGQVNRRSFSLNLYGVLLDHGALPTGAEIVAVQAALVLLISGLAFFFGRTPLRAAGLALVGFALVTPFLSYSILVALVPVALVGSRPRWWLWGAAVVGSLNYDLGLSVVAWQWGLYAPTDLLDVALTLLLLGLFVAVWREKADGSAGATTPGAAAGAAGP